MDRKSLHFSISPSLFVFQIKINNFFFKADDTVIASASSAHDSFGHILPSLNSRICIAMGFAKCLFSGKSKSDVGYSRND